MKSKNESESEIKKKENFIKGLRIRSTKFLGPNPVSMSLDNINHTKKHSVLEKYVVTEKADGIRSRIIYSK